MARLLRLAPVLALVLMITACDDEPTGTGGSNTYVHTSVSGHITMAYSGAPVIGARVALVEPLPYRVVNGPVTTDNNGHYSLGNPPAGDWYLFVFSDSALVFDTDDVRVSVRRGQRIKRDIEMMRSELWGMNPPRIAGTVTDARNGRPLEGAYVSGFAFATWHSFVGISIDVEDMTDAAGQYSVVPMEVFNSPGTAQLGISKEGYAPIYMLDVPLPADPDSVLVFDVALQPADGNSAIHGRVVDVNGRAVDGLPVALDYTTIPYPPRNGPAKGDDKPQRVPVLGASLRTDAKGVFEFNDLPPGTYYIDAGFLPDDGYVGSVADDPIFEVAGDELVDVGDLRVVPAVVPLSPANGSTGVDRRPILRWEPVPGADSYQVQAGTGHFLDLSRTVTEPEFQFEEDFAPGARVRWYIRAYRDADPFDETIAESEVAEMFTVAE
ncbi:MAG: carboxypeptidase regulatory-like domain-containing protein [Candidatus Krumholzibacteria bacterium]|nr:carboxypeptidase regulatory-like domain-containing protein [Candidatus Krumholzibacteria bacterium]